MIPIEDNRCLTLVKQPKLRYAESNQVLKKATMKKLPVGIQDFQKIIENNFVYIDKTRIIYELIDRGVCYFFSRPRRFGKSVLISTLEALFANKRNLFKGLWIDSSEYDWQEYPIIRLDFSAIARSNACALSDSIANRLTSIGTQYGITLTKTLLSDLLIELIESLSRKNKVVILIDEYDKPLLDSINNLEIAKEIQQVLASFYSAIKAQDQYIKFIFITGIARFSRTSIFSGLNNLNDITYRNEYAHLVGYSENDLTILQEQIDQVAQQEQVSPDAIKATIQEWYNGFRFSYDDLKVYNPFSVIRYLESGVLANYWFTSGSPGYLAAIIAQHNYTFDGETIESLDGASMSANADVTYDVEQFPLVPLLAQSGYLTIKEYIKEKKKFTLTYPNKEVEEAFLELFAHKITGAQPVKVADLVFDLKTALSKNNLTLFFELLTEFFAEIPHDIHIKLERYYQSIFYVILKLIGAQIVVERRTNIGRIDAVIETTSDIFIIEMKINQTALSALEQIKEKQYYQPYARSDKDIILLGISFDTHRKNISEWHQEALVL